MLSYATKVWHSEVQSCLHVFIVVIAICLPFCIKSFFFLEGKRSAKKMFSVFSTEWGLLSSSGHYDLYGRFSLCLVFELKCVWKFELNSFEGYTFVHLITFSFFFSFYMFYWHLVWKIHNLYYLRLFIIVYAPLIYAPAN
jgi:hypothetical protein